MLTWRDAKRVVVAVVGGTIVLIGLLLGPLPFVPAIVLVPLGLAILATEFVWAQRLLKKVKERTRAAASSLRGGSQAPDLQATHPVVIPPGPCAQSSPVPKDVDPPAGPDREVGPGLVDPVHPPPPRPPDEM